MVWPYLGWLLTQEVTHGRTGTSHVLSADRMPEGATRLVHTASHPKASKHPTSSIIGAKHRSASQIVPSVPSSSGDGSQIASPHLPWHGATHRSRRTSARSSRRRDRTWVTGCDVSHPCHGSLAATLQLIQGPKLLP